MFLRISYSCVRTIRCFNRHIAWIELTRYQSAYTDNENYVPRHNPVSQEDVDQLQDFVSIAGHGLMVLTGAGVSTESGLPDYRSEGVGLYARSPNRPIQFKNFMSSASVRQMYWLRNYAGWPAFSSLQPNASHQCLAKWDEEGIVSCLVTQNVDRLHFKARSKKLVELHGTSHRVKCMGCSHLLSRSDFQEILSSLNPSVSAEVLQVHPDGDVEVDASQLAGFRVPSCPQCNGILKPDVVFFGESVPGDTVREVYKQLEAATALLVLGSSLEVYSGYRFVYRASELKKPVAIVNIGPTRGDSLAEIKLQVKCSEILTRIKSF